MPIVLKKGVLKLKDRTSGEYRKSINVVGEASTDDMISAVNQAGATQVAAVEAASDAAQSILPTGTTLADLAHNFADEYNVNTSYSIGDYCVHDYKIYVCNTDIESPSGTWDDAKWDLITTFDRISNILDVLKYKKFEYSNGYIKTNIQVVDLSDVVLSPNYRYSVMDCQENDLFLLNVTGGSEPRSWAFIDVSNNVLSRSDASTVNDNTVLIAPKNSSKIVINDKKTYKNSYGFSSDFIDKLYGILDSRINDVISSGLLYRKKLINSDDLNNIQEPGYYFIDYQNIPSHYPSDADEGPARMLVVKSTNQENYSGWQLLIEKNRMFYRSNSYTTSSGWSPWNMVSTYADIINNKKYIPIAPHQIDYDIPSISTVVSELGVRSRLEAVYELWDSLVEEYPQFITKHVLTLSDDIVNSLPSASGYADGDTILLKVGSNPDTYNQYRKLNGSWEPLNTWDTNQAIRKDVYFSYMYTDEDDHTTEVPIDLCSYVIEPYKNCGFNKIIWVSNIHGGEIISQMSTYYMFKELLENGFCDNSLNSVLANHTIVVIPAAGPSAAVENYGSHDMSINGVNPNRDFPTSWAMSTGEYDKTGNYPLYDPYDRMLKEYIESLLSDSDGSTIYLVTKHDSASISSETIIGYLTDNFVSTNEIEKGVLKQLDYMFKNKYSWLSGDFIGEGWDPTAKSLFDKRNVSPNHGTLDKWTGSLGIRSALLEMAGDAGAMYRNYDSKYRYLRKMHTETSINLLNAISNNEDLATSSLNLLQ